jgi:uncharacterized protein (DUF342 family)
MSTLNNGQFSNPNAGTDSSKPQLFVRISENRQEAFVWAKNVTLGQQIQEEDVKRALEENGVVFGILPDAIKTFCANPTRETLCAHGIPAQNEGNGEIEYFFRTDECSTPKQLEDGTVDYSSLDMVQSVKKGDLLCRIVPPEPGKDGTDVTGKTVPYKKGHLPSLPSGRNLTFNEERTEVRAAIDGCIEYRKGILNINDTFYVRGNVDSSSGNISFGGTVVVQGDVTAGYTVKAGGDIMVYGMVIGATLEAGGSITVSKGVNGMLGGYLKAGGNVVARYFQSAKVISGCDVYADTLMNCDVDAGGRIIMRGPNSSIMGGKCQAGHRIYAKMIGTTSYALTELIITSPDLKDSLSGNFSRANEIAELKQKIMAENLVQQDCARQLKLISSTLGSREPSARTQNLIKSITNRQKESENDVYRYSKRIEELENAPIVPLSEFNVAVLRTAYPGTKITIGTVSMMLNNKYDHMKFYLKGDQIVTGPILPSDEEN